MTIKGNQKTTKQINDHSYTTVSFDGIVGAHK